MQCLARQGEDFRRIIAPVKEDALHGLATFLDAFDVRTCYPLLLAILDARPPEDEWRELSSVLESYLLRRAVCGLTTKNYNKIFLGLVRNLRRTSFSAADLARLLIDQEGESTEWPSDARFAEAWRNQHAYRVLSNPKIVYILKRISDTYATSKSEAVQLEGALTVEHLLPQNWVKNWPLSDGRVGLTVEELWRAQEDETLVTASRTRHAVVQTLGNLTILTQSLNSSLSNAAWPDKQKELRHSLLPINRMLHDYAHWDEKAVEQRSEELLSRALKLWPRAAT